MKLYEIDKAIESLVNPETGEIMDFAMFENLQMSREQKIENIALWIKNLLSDADELKKEKDAFTEREKSAKSKSDSLKRYLSEILCGQTFQTTKTKITFRKSESISVTDIYAVPDEWYKEVIPNVDAMRAKKAIKSGEVIPGIEIVEKQNIQIK